MNATSPRDETYFEGCELPMIINIQKEFKTGIVKTASGKKFPVTIADGLIDGIQLMDYVDLKKSAVTGEWIVTNYFINTEVYQEIEDSYKTPCNYGDDCFCEDCMYQDTCAEDVIV